MGRTLLFVHGRNFKPRKKDLWKIWLEATRFGIERDYAGKLEAFDSAKKEMIYYGDISNKFLRSRGRECSAPADVRDRREALRELKGYASNGFTKRRYGNLPGKSSLKEFLADSLGPPLNWFGLTNKMVESVAPDMREYWNPDSSFGSETRAQMVSPLRRAMDRGDKILVVAHSLGAIVSYDTFWKFSRMGEYKPYWKKKVDFWITLGSPLGDETVKDQLRGSSASGERRFPSNVVRWENVAAEDDYISHDERVKNDFKKMLRFGLVSRLRDHQIYNLAVRSGRSNPHSSVGYLIHPKVSELIANWL